MSSDELCARNSGCGAVVDFISTIACDDGVHCEIARSQTITNCIKEGNCVPRLSMASRSLSGLASLLKTSASRTTNDADAMSWISPVFPMTTRLFGIGLDGSADLVRAERAFHRDRNDDTYR